MPAAGTGLRIVVSIIILTLWCRLAGVLHLVALLTCLFAR
jgi:hypothetical protein